MDWMQTFKAAEFQGIAYALPQNWFEIVPVEDKPIKYLEIGALYGANMLCVAASYGKHPESKLYCIDPWCDYVDYPEYKEQQKTIYETFLSNTKDVKNLTVIRGYSHAEVPKLDDEYFDIIYIDGNHEPEYVLEDAVHAYRKLKKGGYLIFDDYGWGEPGNETTIGMQAFATTYKKRIEVVGVKGNQLFIRKTDPDTPQKPPVTEQA